MTVSILDDRIHCLGFYSENILSFRSVPPAETTVAWEYHNVFDGRKDVVFAELYCGGKTLSEICPENLKEDWDRLIHRKKAYLKAVQIAKLDISEHCFYDLVPRKFLIEYYSVRNKIIDSVIRDFPRPVNYEFLLDLKKMCLETSQRELNLNVDFLKSLLANDRARKLYGKIQAGRTRILYDIFGTRTGRLTTQKRSFPIHNLDKQFRKVLQPTNDCFVELDLASAELRTLLSLSRIEQPEYDVYEWLNGYLYDNSHTREEVKLEVISWLYSERSDARLESIFDRQKLIEEYCSDNVVRTPFGRAIIADTPKNRLNYLLQSTTSDIVQKSSLKIRDRLKGCYSFVAFTLQDSVVVDLSRDDKLDIKELKELFEKSEIGNFKAKVNIGKNFGEMESWKSSLE